MTDCRCGKTVVTDHATPRHVLALAEMLDHEAQALKMRGRECAPAVAKQIRRIADVLEGKV